ncbi:MAG: hypothetical protein JNM56_19445 [Planctomycetia bacterium]|nr:hypothetical protein [Planctomycetia bacterium]
MIATQSLRAPQQDETLLAEPPLSAVPRLLDDNRRRLERLPIRLLGRPLAELRAEASEQARAAAVDYLRQAGEAVPAYAAPPILLAGHQPELFHPGVWIKNFALHALARRHGLTPINLVVDNDTVKAAAVRVPAYGADGARLATVPFDIYQGEVPYEERTVQDEALFGSFAERAGELLRPWDYPSLLPAFWNEVQRQAGRTALLGERFAAARRTVERRWGCQNLELPVSRLCGIEPFAWFACQLLADLQRFHLVYNTTVQDHRRSHGIRSKNHPVADLTADGDWREAPFWAWRAGQTQRGRPLARLRDGRIELRIGQDSWPSLPWPDDPHATVAAWRALEAQGYKLRPRALTMTMFTRLVLGDLFIHGIGGGKYDELTDEIVRRYWQCESPRFMVLSATLHLPLPAANVKQEQRLQAARQVRDLHWNPQRHLNAIDLPSPSDVQTLMARTAVGERPETKAERRRWFQELRGYTERLRPFVRDQSERAAARLATIDRELAEAQVTQRRDYAFCLFPEKKLRDAFGRLLGE